MPNEDNVQKKNELKSKKNKSKKKTTISFEPMIDSKKTLKYEDGYEEITIDDLKNNTLLLESENSLSRSNSNIERVLEETLGFIESNILISEKDANKFSNLNIQPKLNVCVLDNNKIISSNKRIKKDVFLSAKNPIYPFQKNSIVKGTISKRIDNEFIEEQINDIEIVNLDSIIKANDIWLNRIDGKKRDPKSFKLSKKLSTVQKSLFKDVENNRNLWLKELKKKSNYNVLDVQFEYKKTENKLKINWKKPLEKHSDTVNFRYKIELWNTSKTTGNKCQIEQTSETNIDINIFGLKNRLLLLRIIPLSADEYGNRVVDDVLEYDNDFVYCYPIYINDFNTEEENKEYVSIEKRTTSNGINEYIIKSLLVPNIDIRKIKYLEIKYNDITKISYNTMDVKFREVELFDKRNDFDETIERQFIISIYTNTNSIVDSYTAKVKIKNPFYNTDNRMAITKVFNTIDRNVSNVENDCKFDLSIDPNNKNIEIKKLNVKILNNRTTKYILRFEIFDSFKMSVFTKNINLIEYKTRADSNLKLTIFENNPQTIKNFEIMNLKTTLITGYDNGLSIKKDLMKFSGLVNYFVDFTNPYLSFFEIVDEDGLGYYFYFANMNSEKMFVKLIDMNINTTPIFSSKDLLLKRVNKNDFIFEKSQFIPKSKLNTIGRNWLFEFLDRNDKIISDTKLNLVGE